MNSGFGKGLFWGFVAGATAGVLAGILMAPKKGKEVRNSIAYRINQFLETDDSDDYSYSTHHLVNEGKNKGEALIEDAKEQAQELLADADRLLQEIKSKSGKVISPQ